MFNSTKHVLIFFLLSSLVITVLVYWPGLNGPFLLDDYLNVVQAYVGELDISRIYYVATHNESGILGRPASMVSFIFSGLVHGPDPWGYKFHNLIIHLANGLLVYLLIFRVLSRLAPKTDQKQHMIVAGLTSLMWLLHPLMVSTVLYVVQRMAQLSALFTLASLLIYLELRERTFKKPWSFYVLGYAVFPLIVLLAVFSKENGALIPVYILAIEFIVFRARFNDAVTRRRIAVFLAIFVLIPLVGCSLYMVTHFERFTNYALREFTMPERLMTELHVIVAYLKMILLPRLSDMTLFHDYFPVTRQLDWSTGILFLLLITAISAVFFWRKKAPVAAFAIAWFIVSHLLESTFLSLEIMFEHRNYLAAMGPLLAVVYYAANVPGYPKVMYYNVIFLVMIVFLCFVRVQEWTARESIFQVAIAEHPDSYRAQTEMATLQYRAGNLEAAIAHLEVVKQLRRNDFGPVIHQAVFLCGSGNDLSPWFEDAEEKARQYPVTTYSLTALDNMAVVLGNGDCPELDGQTILRLVEIAKAQPDNQTHENYIGFLEKIEGQIYLIQGDARKGMGLLLSAYNHTGMVRILANMAEILLSVDRLNEAEQIIGYMEGINEESGGVETALLIPLREQLEQARTGGPSIE